MSLLNPPTNWRTNTMGAILLALAIAQIWLPKYSTQIQQTAVAVAGVGFFASKDNNK